MIVITMKQMAHGLSVGGPESNNHATAQKSLENYFYATYFCLVYTVTRETHLMYRTETAGNSCFYTREYAGALRRVNWQ
jgi:hypothetical protein